LERVVPLDTDIGPEAAVSGAIVFQTEHETMLSFNATRLHPDGRYYDAGCAVVRFKRCNISKFGYPNDEAWSGIPRTKGLDYGCYEILDSPWPAELCELNKHSFPNSKPSTELRHFLFLFHDSSFECLAEDYSMELIPAGFERYLSVVRRFLAPAFGEEPDAAL